VAVDAVDGLGANTVGFSRMGTRDLPIRMDIARFDAEARALVDANASASLDAAREALARAYGVASWTRLEQACRMTTAIAADDLEAVRALVTRIRNFSSKVRAGRTAIGGRRWRTRRISAEIASSSSFTRAARPTSNTHSSGPVSKVGSRRRGGSSSSARRPRPAPRWARAKRSTADGLALLVELGVPLTDERGDRLAPVGLVLQTYSRWPDGKHRCLELLAESGVELPDTPTMAVHRGRIDLLERWVSREPDVLERTFAHDEIWPVTLGV
jgi:hypothetical protein